MKMDEYNDEVQEYKFMLKRTFVADRKSAICNINVSMKNDVAAISFKSNDIATIELNSIIYDNNNNYNNK